MSYITCDWAGYKPRDGYDFSATAKAHEGHVPGDMGDCDAFRCVCGNTASGSGLFPCDRAGNEVEPTAKDWPEELYVCGDCGRVVEAKTGLVIKEATHA
jgi:hypothetical protein